MTLKEVEIKIGKENLNEFLKWMDGQTIGIYADSGLTDYYDNDVYAFKNKLDKNIDRQSNPLTFD